MSRKSRDAGNQWWGRITGTPAHDEAQQFVASKLRSFGMDVRLEETAAAAGLVPDRLDGERRGRRQDRRR